MVKREKLGNLLTESRILSVTPNANRRITVRLNVKGLEKRPFENEIAGATKQFVRKAGQFIYGKQNFHKGAFGIIPPELDNYESSSDLPSFDVSRNCLPEWIYYYFKTGNRYLELENIARGVGSKRIHPEQLSEIEIPLPDIPEQNKIINKLKKDELKHLKLKYEISYQQSILKKLRQAILQEAVQGKLVKQDKNDEPAIELLKRIKAEKEKLIAEGKLRKEKPLSPIKEEELPFALPKGWAWCRLGDVATFITKGSSPKWQGIRYVEEGKGILFVTSKNVGLYNLILDHKSYVETRFNEIEPKSILKQNDLLCNLVGGSIGRSAIYDLDEIANINQAVCLIRISSKSINRNYLLHYLNSPLAIGLMFEKQFAPGRANLSLISVNSFVLPLPPLNEQNKIVSKISNHFSMCDQLEKQIEENAKHSEILLQAVLKEVFEEK